jgi:hypothetical protein
MEPSLLAGRSRYLALAIVLIVIVGTVAWFVSAHARSGTRASSAGTVRSSNPGALIHRQKHKPTSDAPTPTTPPSITNTTVTPAALFPAAVLNYVNSRTDSVTASLYDISTGHTYVLRPGVTEDEASIVKIDIMATWLSQVPGGSIPSSPSEQELLSTMIEESDNDSATSLWDQVGGPDAITTFNQKIGMTSTTPSQCVTCANFPWPGWGLTTTTAADQIRLFEQFVLPSSLLAVNQRSFGLGLMEHDAPSELWGVDGGVPSGTTIALKNGWLPLVGDTDWQVNSVGWIDGDGRDYLLAVLTTNNPTEDYGIGTINDISSLIWNQLG